MLEQVLHHVSCRAPADRALLHKITSIIRVVLEASSLESTAKSLQPLRLDPFAPATSFIGPGAYHRTLCKAVVVHHMVHKATVWERILVAIGAQKIGTTGAALCHICD